MTIKGDSLMSLTILPNMTIEIWLGGQWLTNTTTDEIGEFSASIPARRCSLGRLF